jgi:hypothetical protein
MTLIEAYAGGQLIGRCDERCYDAKELNCHCICQSANHGVGLKKALENTRARHEEWKKAERTRRGKQRIRFVSPPVDQPSFNWQAANDQKG